jgi:hypothetical protein
MDEKRMMLNALMLMMNEIKVNLIVNHTYDAFLARHGFLFSLIL